jgi:hypothetical protein
MSLFSLLGRVYRDEDLSGRSTSREASFSLYLSREQRLHSQVGSLQDIIQEALELTSDTTSHSSPTCSNASRHSLRTRNGNSTYSNSTEHGPPESSKQ